MSAGGAMLPHRHIKQMLSKNASTRRSFVANTSPSVVFVAIRINLGQRRTPDPMEYREARNPGATPQRGIEVQEPTLM